MKKAVVSILESIRKTEKVKYEILIPKQIKNIDRYIENLWQDGRLQSDSKILSIETVKGEILENEIIKIEV